MGIRDGLLQISSKPDRGADAPAQLRNHLISLIEYLADIYRVKCLGNISRHQFLFYILRRRYRIKSA